MKNLQVFWDKSCKQLYDLLLYTALQDLFRIRLIASGEAALPKSAYDPSRDQYDAGWVLDSFENKELSLYLTDKDLYYPGYTFLYGASEGTSCIVSSFRTSGSDHFIREVCHELGHLFGLAHCGNECVMRSSGALNPDLKAYGAFCPECLRKLRKAVQ